MALIRASWRPNGGEQTAHFLFSSGCRLPSARSMSSARATLQSAVNKEERERASASQSVSRSRARLLNPAHSSSLSPSSSSSWLTLPGKRAPLEANRRLPVFSLSLPPFLFSDLVARKLCCRPLAAELTVLMPILMSQLGGGKGSSRKWQLNATRCHLLALSKKAAAAVDASTRVVVSVNAL